VKKNVTVAIHLVHSDPKLIKKNQNPSKQTKKFFTDPHFIHDCISKSTTPTMAHRIADGNKMYEWLLLRISIWN